MEIEIILGLLSSLIATILYTLTTYEQVRRRRKRAPTLEQKIATLVKNLEVASAAISDIEIEISKRSELAEKLRQDVRRYEELKKLNEAQVEAIASTLRGEISAMERRSRYVNAVITFIIAFVFFVLGLVVGRA